MHKSLKESTMEAMAMMMLGASAIIPHHDYRQGIGPKARKKKKPSVANKSNRGARVTKTDKEIRIRNYDI